jgi:hypothetical protein
LGFEFAERSEQEEIRARQHIDKTNRPLATDWQIAVEADSARRHVLDNDCGCGN